MDLAEGHFDERIWSSRIINELSNFLDFQLFGCEKLLVVRPC